MPIEKLHKDKLRTNMAILAALLAFCALLFGITIVKMHMQKSEPIPPNLILSEEQNSTVDLDETSVSQALPTE